MYQVKNEKTGLFEKFTISGELHTSKKSEGAFKGVEIKTAEEHEQILKSSTTTKENDKDATIPEAGTGESTTQNPNAGESKPTVWREPTENKESAQTAPAKTPKKKKEKKQESTESADHSASPEKKTSKEWADQFEKAGEFQLLNFDGWLGIEGGVQKYFTEVEVTEAEFRSKAHKSAIKPLLISG